MKFLALVVSEIFKKSHFVMAADTEVVADIDNSVSENAFAFRLKMKPVAFCLQESEETLLSDFYNFNNCLQANTKISGGVGIVVRKSAPHSALALAVACRISTPQTLTICPVYLPPSSTWHHTDLLNLISQLP